MSTTTMKLKMPNGEILEPDYPATKGWAKSWSVRYPDTGQIGTTGETEDEIVERYGLTAILQAAMADASAQTALESIASIKRGVQSVYENYHDVNARNYHEMMYWRKLCESYQNRARAALQEMGERP